MVDIFVNEVYGVNQLKHDDETRELTFSNKSESYCVSFIDIIGSSQITSNLQSSRKLKSFYTIFINKIADIVKDYDGKILKTVGDGVIFFFPETCNIENQQAFENAVECLLSMVSSRNEINGKLPAAISYRISADYGKLEVARSGQVNGRYDLFGSTLNFCNKINKKAPSNGIAIGADLWRIVNSFPTLVKIYHFREVKELAWKENRYSYPVYVLGPAESHIPKKRERATRTERPDIKIDFAPKLLKIMLVDDDPDISLVFGDELRSAGIVVDSFTNSEDALKHFIKLHYHYYDLIVTDIRMPGLNGFELYHQLKAFEPNIKFLFITALDISREIISLLPELKISQFITKPIPPTALVNSVIQHARASSL